MDLTPKKIDSLTSLRFVAAAMIVWHHTGWKFGFDGPAPLYFGMIQGVSFFFVLSGFILAYIYPRLGGIESVGRFWLARVARIWPAHAVSLLLVLVIFRRPNWHVVDASGANSFLIASANFSMVHAWIPLDYYFFSFNGLSWSISTEFFFYLCFPLLIYRWEETWRVKLASAGVLVLTIIVLCNIYRLPGYTNGYGYRGITAPAMLYINPLSRMFEFVVGMSVAYVWRKKMQVIRISKSSGTLLEILALSLAILSVRYSADIAHSWIGVIGAAGSEWISHSASSIFFGLLIFAMAMERGFISRLLSFRLPVLLGEISYSVYLLHQILLRYYNAKGFSFSSSHAVEYGIFWIIVLATSYLFWRQIELPSRRYIVGLWPKRRYSPCDCQSAT